MRMLTDPVFFVVAVVWWSTSCWLGASISSGDTGWLDHLLCWLNERSIMQYTTHCAHVTSLYWAQHDRVCFHASSVPTWDLLPLRSLTKSLLASAVDGVGPVCFTRVWISGRIMEWFIYQIIKFTFMGMETKSRWQLIFYLLKELRLSLTLQTFTLIIVFKAMRSHDATVF